MCCAERDGDLTGLFSHPVSLYDDEDTACNYLQPSPSPSPPLFYVKVHLQVYGDLASADLQQLATCARNLYERRSKYFTRAPQISPLYEAEWTSFLENLQKTLQGSELWCLEASAVLFCDSQCVGGPEQALDWMTETFRIAFQLTHLESFNSAIFQEALLTRQNSVVYLDVSHDSVPVGRLVFELYDHLLPLACRNFRHLCSGEQGISDADTVLWYVGTPVHRIVKGGWLQAGDILDGCGGHGESVYGYRFRDESFAVPHDRRGRLALVQDERNHNHSQFTVAFQPMTYMQYMSCAFGQLIVGSEALNYLETVETNNGRPVKTVAFTNGGVLYWPSSVGDALVPAGAAEDSSENGTPLLALAPPPEPTQEAELGIDLDHSTTPDISQLDSVSTATTLSESKTG